ncbi:MAG: glutathione S-transferase family protein, partial [Pseudomonadota bacterium]
MSLTLYHTPGTRSVRARWILEEMGVPYSLQTIAYDGDYFASPAFREINPMGKIPALYDGRDLIIESVAIMQYVMNRYGPTPLDIHPSDRDHATYLTWLHLGESGMSGYIAVSFGHAANEDPYKVSEAFDAYCRYQVEKAVGMLESRLATGRDYLLDQGFSAADISTGYALLFASVCTGASFPPSVSAYLARLLERPALQRALDDVPL